MIAAIPVLGFIVNGAAYLTGERRVEDAFLSAQGAAQIANASAQFKAGIAAMRIGVRDFMANPNHGAVEAWRREQAKNRTVARRPDLIPPAPPGSQDGR